MRMLILGTGGMAAQHAKHFAAIEGVTLVGGVDVDPNRLEKFNTTHDIPNGFVSLDAAIAWGEFDAVANVTPDSIHHATSIAALKAGKHVFCEKPLATDAQKAFEMVDVAERAGLINRIVWERACPRSGHRGAPERSSVFVPMPSRASSLPHWNCVESELTHHSAKLPSAWRQIGLRQRWPMAARSMT